MASDTFDVDAQVTPFAGVTYDLNANTTLYASYSEIFIPQSEVDSAGGLLDPVTGEQFEIGVKATLGYGLDVSAALFDLRETNRPVSVIGTNYFVAEEEVRSRGLELTLAGEVMDNLHLAGGYTYTDTEYLNGTSAGQDFSTYTPEHMFKLVGNYDVTQGAMAGWSFGGRLTVLSGFSSRGVEAPGYGIVDLMAAKDLGNDVMLRVGVDNVLDRDYYTRVGSSTVFNFRGEPRTFNLAVTKTF